MHYIQESWQGRPSPHVFPRMMSVLKRWMILGGLLIKSDYLVETADQLIIENFGHLNI